MSADSLKKAIENEMRLKTTEELLDIWTKNDRAEWTDEAFEVVYELLLEKLEDIPEQGKPNYKRVDTTSPDIKKILTSTSFLTGWGIFPFFLVLAIGTWLISVIQGNGEETSFVPYAIFYALIFPFVLVIGLVMIKRREVWRTGLQNIKGWAAIAIGVFVIGIFVISEFFFLSVIFQALVKSLNRFL
jgi:hypothetical protein